MNFGRKKNKMKKTLVLKYIKHYKSAKMKKEILLFLFYYAFHYPTYKSILRIFEWSSL